MAFNNLHLVSKENKRSPTNQPLLTWQKWSFKAEEMNELFLWSFIIIRLLIIPIEGRSSLVLIGVSGQEEPLVATVAQVRQNTPSLECSPPTTYLLLILWNWVRSDCKVSVEWFFFWAQQSRYLRVGRFFLTWVDDINN